MSIESFAPLRGELEKRLGKYLPEGRVFVYGSTDSTSTRAKEYISDPEYRGEDALFIALEQTAGRGQKGRSFVSEAGLGLYMSYLCHKPISAAYVPYLTAYAAVAVAEAIEDLSGARAGIKWVNDVFIGDKKVSGILTEGAFLPGTDKISHAIVGIGVNLYNRDFGELSDIASDIESETGVRVSLCDIAERIISVLSRDMPEKEQIAQRYKCRSILEGRRVLVEDGEGEYFAEVIGVTDSLSLKVRREGSEELELLSGRVSIRF